MLEHKSDQMPRLSHALTLKLTEGMVAEIDEWRRQQPDLPNRAEAIRRLILTNPALTDGRVRKGR